MYLDWTWTFNWSVIHSSVIYSCALSHHVAHFSRLQTGSAPSQFLRLSLIPVKSCTQSLWLLKWQWPSQFLTHLTTLSSPVVPQLLGRNAAGDKAESLTELTGATLAHSLSHFIKKAIRLTMPALTLLNPGWLSDWPISWNPLAWTRISNRSWGGGSCLLE